MNETDLREKYQAFCNERMTAAVAEFNKDRKKYRNISIIEYVMLAGFSLMFLSLVLYFLMPRFSFLENTMIIAVISSFALIGITFGIMRAFYPDITDLSGIDPEAKIKSALMPDFMKLFGNFEWKKKRETLVYDYNKLQQTMIVPQNITVVGDDCISGRYEDVGINITEMTVGKMAFFLYILLFSVGGLLLYLFISRLILPIVLMVIMAFGVFIHAYIAYALLGITVVFALYWLIKLIYKIFVHFLTVGYFRGAMIELDMPKKFSGHTFLFENAFSAGAIKRKNKTGYERVILEDSAFNKIWSIYSDNQQEARYVLTPAFMERLKNISLAFEAKYLRMSFKNNKMTLLAASPKDLFAMGNIFKNTDKSTFDTLFNEMLSVLQLVDDLKLRKEYRL